MCKQETADDDRCNCFQHIDEYNDSDATFSENAVEIRQSWIAAAEFTDIFAVKILGRDDRTVDAADDIGL